VAPAGRSSAPRWRRHRHDSSRRGRWRR
jgi:hypothetical protein